MRDTFRGGIKRGAFNGAMPLSVTAQMNDRIPIGAMTVTLVAAAGSSVGGRGDKCRYATLEIVRCQRTGRHKSRVRESAIGEGVITRGGDYSETAGKSERGQKNGEDQGKKGKRNERARVKERRDGR